MTTIPKSVREEHEAIFAGLRRLARTDGSTGKATRSLLGLLEPHIEKEDMIAMPLLGAVPSISKGKRSRRLDEVISLQGKLTKTLPIMLAEHDMIRGRIAKAKEAAKKESNLEALLLLASLEHHAKMEEEVLYPAAVLAGIAARNIEAARA